MILGKKDKDRVAQLEKDAKDYKEISIEATKKYNDLKDKYNTLLNKGREADLDLLMSKTGLTLKELSLLSGLSHNHLNSWYRGETHASDEEFYSFICKVVRGLLRMSS